MAIPLFAVVAVGGGVVGIATIDDSKEKMNRANDINREAQRIADNSTKKRDRTRKATNDTLAELGKTKLSIMAGNILRFAENFSRIKNVRLNDSVGLEELRDFNPASNDFLKMKDAGFKASEVMQGGVGSIAAGTLTAAGAYGAVGALATASTGTAISALSGAAATNATLAWLGGGAIAVEGGGMALGTVVLGGLVVAPALIVMGLFMGAKADEALSKAKSQRDEARKYQQDVANLCTVMEAVSARAEQINELLLDLNEKFKPAVDRMIGLIYNRGDDWRYYSQYEKQTVGVAVQLAQTIKIVIDTSLLREDGSLRDNETQKALTAGQKTLDAID